ncbi:MAG: DUF2975 domain-containing protein [Pseudomonadota bacterium]
MLPAYELPDRTRKWCAILKWISVVLIVLMLADLLFAGVLQRIIQGHYLALSDMARQDVNFSNNKTRLLHALAFTAWSGATLILIAVLRLFSTLTDGEPFSTKVQHAIRFLGAMILLNGIIGVFMKSAFTLALTYDNPPGKGELSIAISSSQISYLLVGGIILILGHIFLQAVRISDENRQIV